MNQENITSRQSPKNLRRLWKSQVPTNAAETSLAIDQGAQYSQVGCCFYPEVGNGFPFRRTCLLLPKIPPTLKSRDENLMDLRPNPDELVEGFRLRVQWQGSEFEKCWLQVWYPVIWGPMVGGKPECPNLLVAFHQAFGVWLFGAPFLLQVLETKDQQIKVHFDTWGAEHDEWIARDSQVVVDSFLGKVGILQTLKCLY